MSDTADHLEREIETHRANVEDTLDKLRGRLSVDQVVDDIGQFMGLEDVRGTLATAGRQVRENPLALGLIGIGMVWLLMGRSQTDPGPANARKEQSHTPYSGVWPASGFQGDTARSGTKAEGDTFRDKVADRASEMKETASDAVHDLADKVGHAASGLTGSVRHLAADVADKVHARDLMQPISRRMEQQPLLLGGVALIAGAVIGAALPRTRMEDRLLGEQRDRLMHEAREATRGLKDRATEAAQRTYDAAVQAAGEEGLVPQGDTTIAERVENVAAAALSEARDQVEPVVHGAGEEPVEHEGAGVLPNRTQRHRK